MLYRSLPVIYGTANFARDVSYACKMLMKSTTGIHCVCFLMFICLCGQNEKMLIITQLPVKVYLI
jgi:hypothetical protein